MRLFLIQKKYFIINSKIIALCNRYHSALLTYIYIQTHTHASSCLLERGNGRHTLTHTYIPTLHLVCTNTHTSHGSVSTSRIASNTYMDKWLHTADLVDDDRHTHTPIPMLDCLYKHSLILDLQECLPYTGRTTRNLRTCFTSMGQIFLLETVVLQTVQ